MDYTMCNSSIKGKMEVKLIISPTNNLERQFFTELSAGVATIETIANSDDIIITLKEKESL